MFPSVCANQQYLKASLTIDFKKHTWSTSQPHSTSMSRLTICSHFQNRWREIDIGTYRALEFVFGYRPSLRFKSKKDEPVTRSNDPGNEHVDHLNSGVQHPYAMLRHKRGEQKEIDPHIWTPLSLQCYPKSQLMSMNAGKEYIDIIEGQRWR